MAAKMKSTKKRAARTSSFYISCLNIVLQPHTTQKYIKLLEKIFSEKIDAKVRGDDAIMIGSFHKLAEDSDEVYTGHIYKYLKLNAAEDWFNTLKMDAASKEDVRDINIPEHLKPHFKRIPYIFYPRNHRLYFITQKTGATLSPFVLKKFFDIASENEKLADFGQLSVTVQPEKGITENFFSIHRISTIELEILKPNPDDHDDLEEDILERLNNMNAKKETIQYVEADKAGLKPDKRLESLAKIAAENGEIHVRGKNANGEIVDLHSKSHPLRAPARYNPDAQSELDALAYEAEKIHAEISRKNAG